MGRDFDARFLGFTQMYSLATKPTVELKDDKPQLKFPGVGRSDHAEYLRHVLEQATSAVGGVFARHPFGKMPGGQEITYSKR